MTLMMEPRILSFEISTTILCDPTGKPPRARRFSTSFRSTYDNKLRPDSVLDYLSSTASGNMPEEFLYQRFSTNGLLNHTSLNVLGVLDMLGHDLITIMWMRKRTWFILFPEATPVPEAGYVTWNSQMDLLNPTHPDRLHSWQTYTEGFWYKGEYISVLNTTIANIFVAVRDAIK
ncbi:hypothetical protein FRC09_010147 [Ceratobasidium sp. 395]|nr:hypothetical protein FRC09_010147 [Ceratobasidium sp. 395]